MAAITSSLKPTQQNRRRRVRHQIQTPAYASFSTESEATTLDLHEIVNISEDGVAIHCHTPLQIGSMINLCLDLAECSDHIFTTGQVVWSNSSGRAGLRFAELKSISLLRLREWLFLNAMAGVANTDAVPVHDQFPMRPNYTDTLAGVTAVQREVEGLGADLVAALPLIATRAQSLVRASGAAIALIDEDPSYMVCRACSGPDAPPVGARLQSGSGFSGECVSTGRLLRCDDTEIDSRVDRESCRALGLRSMVAVPIRVGEKSIGLLEVFSAQSGAFTESDSKVLQRLADTILAAVNRAARAESLPALEPSTPAIRFDPAPGSVLFASNPAEAPEKSEGGESTDPHGISLPRSLLMLLVGAAAVIAMVLGYALAPWIQSDLAPWVQRKVRAQSAPHLESVLASSKAPAPATGASTASSGPAVETASLDQLRGLAEKGDPAAQNSLGLRYINGEGVKQSEHEAVRWLTKAAEQGNVAAQSKLGAIYWAGRGVPVNYNQAYFWSVLARAGGDQASKDRAMFVGSHLTRAQAASIEQEADHWIQQHTTNTKPPAGH
ncbi:MAG TPA: GAF domain-containing protein [Candidatus Sulfotelmatobacter sp.]|nr:GAF domain-containing protein [Candidatus Sulfotelmatobacter sp.]